MATAALLLNIVPRVYVTQEPHSKNSFFDFRPAESFGDITFLTGDDLHNLRDSPHNEWLMRQLRRRLRKFNPEIDWILVAGSPYVSAAVFMILGSFGLREVKVLRWSNQDKLYTPLYMKLPIN